jgi:hypothetical protein
MGYENNMGVNGAFNVKAKKGKADGAGSLWYEINYNHRQAWVPANEVTLAQTPGGQ